MTDARSAYGGGRVTAQRAAIAAAASTFEGAFTIEALAAALRSRDGRRPSTATVYRAVAALEMNGFVERVGISDGSALYAWCEAGGHHHHVVCEQCGRIERIECPLRAPTSGGAAAPDGFVVTRHEVAFYGICPTCANGEGGGR